MLRKETRFFFSRQTSATDLKTYPRAVMSNESSRQNPDPEKILGKTVKEAHDANEMDLWDLDFEATEYTSAHGETGIQATGLPTRRNLEPSSIQSRKPIERHIQVPALGTIKDVEKPDEKPEAAQPEVIADTREAPEKEWQDLEENNPEAPTQDIKPAWILASLSKVEKIAISGLVAALVLGATLTLIHFSKKVPTRPLVSEGIDYPVSGKIIEITKASTYWRKPVATGENPDVVRRGTVLIPVLKMNINAGSGAIRVFFRNEDGLVVGDGITRDVRGGTEISIAATAGFEDLGMHTAYRTGDSPPWVVQVFEGPGATAPSSEFHKVLETEISTLIR